MKRLLLNAVVATIAIAPVRAEPVVLDLDEYPFPNTVAMGIAMSSAAALCGIHPVQEGAPIFKAAAAEMKKNDRRDEILLAAQSAFNFSKVEPEFCTGMKIMFARQSLRAAMQNLPY